MFRDYLLSSYSPLVTWTNEKELTNCCGQRNAAKEREQESCVIFKCPRTFFATEMLIDCSFPTKNCSLGSSELKKVPCQALI